MKRYTGGALPPNSRIAVIANDAIGNFVVATPLLQMLRAKHQPAHLEYFGGLRTKELQDASDLMDRSVAWHGSPIREMAGYILGCDPFDLVVNLEWTAWAKTAAALLASKGGAVCGPCLAEGGRGDLPFSDDPVGELWRDADWMSAELCERHPIVKTGFIGEIFCRGAYLEGNTPGYMLPLAKPPADMPDVLIAPGASLTEKTWPYESWASLLGRLTDRGVSRIGLLGAPPIAQQLYWQAHDTEQRLVDEGYVEDWRGKLSLPQIVGQLAQTRLVVSIDNGILHLAVGCQTPTVGLYRPGIARLWAPPFAQRLKVLEPEPGEVVADIPWQRTWEAIEALL